MSQSKNNPDDMMLSQRNIEEDFMDLEDEEEQPEQFPLYTQFYEQGIYTLTPEQLKYQKKMYDQQKKESMPKINTSNLGIQTQKTQTFGSSLHLESPKQQSILIAGFQGAQQFQQEQQNQSKQQQEQLKLHLGEELRDSSIIVSLLIKEIYKKSEQLAYERYIDKKINDFSAHRTLELTNQIFLSDLAILDEDEEESETQNLIALEDQEPQKPVREAWLRVHAEIELPEVLEEADQMLMTHISKDSPKNQSVYSYGRNSQLSFTSKSKSKHAPKKKAWHEIDANKPESREPYMEIDKDAEIYRKQKEQELKRVREKEEIHQKQKQEQIKISKEIQQNQKAKTTFDYNGLTIIQKQVKIEKLVPPLQKVDGKIEQQGKLNFNQGIKFEEQVTQAEVVKKQHNRSNQQVNNSQMSDNANKISRRPSEAIDPNQLNKMAQVQKIPLNEFNPKQGVTLMYNQQIKEGPKIKDQIHTIEDLEYRIKTANPKEPLQISKNEYQRLTQYGNLKANFKSENDNGNNNNVLKDLEANQSRFSKTQFGKIQEMDQSYSQERKNKTGAYFKKKQGPNKITINSHHLAELVVNDDNNGQIEKELEYLRKNQKKNENIERKQQEQNKRHNPIDDFILQMKQKGEWGGAKQNNRSASFLPQIKQTSKQNLKGLQSTVNTIYKLPRERGNIQGQKIEEQMRKTQDFNSTGNPYKFRGNFQSTHSKFWDTLRGV